MSIWRASLVAPGVILGAGGRSGHRTNFFAALGLESVVSLGGSYGQSPTYGEGRFLRYSPNYYMRGPEVYNTPVRYYGYRSPYDSGPAHLGDRFAGGPVGLNAGFQIRFPDIIIGSGPTHPTPQALDPHASRLSGPGWRPYRGAEDLSPKGTVAFFNRLREEVTAPPAGDPIRGHYQHQPVSTYEQLTLRCNG